MSRGPDPGRDERTDSGADDRARRGRRQPDLDGRAPTRRPVGSTDAAGEQACSRIVVIPRCPSAASTAVDSSNPTPRKIEQDEVRPPVADRRGYSAGFARRSNVRVASPPEKQLEQPNVSHLVVDDKDPRLIVGLIRARLSHAVRPLWMSCRAWPLGAPCACTPPSPQAVSSGTARSTYSRPRDLWSAVDHQCR